MTDRDARPWIKLSLDYFDNPKIDALSDNAQLLHLQLMLRTARQKKDGEVTVRAAKARGETAFKELVSAGLLIKEDPRTYRIHDYDKTLAVSDAAPSKGLSLPFCNPPRLPEREGHGKGRSFGPSRYVIAWPDGIVKIGITSLGRRRWGMFLARGGTMLDLAFYESVDESVQAEVWLERTVALMGYGRPFAHKSDAERHLGNRGGGYTECHSIPVSDWPEIVQLAKKVTHGVVQR